MGDIRHGTASGYRAHRRCGEGACSACLAAENRRSRARTAARTDSVPGSRADTDMLRRRAQARAQIVAINHRDALEATT